MAQNDTEEDFVSKQIIIYKRERSARQLDRVHAELPNPLSQDVTAPEYAFLRDNFQQNLE